MSAPICKKKRQFFTKMKAKTEIIEYQYVMEKNCRIHFEDFDLYYKN